MTDNPTCQYCGTEIFYGDGEMFNHKIYHQRCLDDLHGEDEGNEDDNAERYVDIPVHESL